MKKIRVAMVGLGNRGYGIVYKNELIGLLSSVILENPKAEVCAVCDFYEDRVKRAQALIKEKQGNDVFGTTDYNDFLKRDDIDLIVITSAWETHIPFSIAAMEAGIPVAVEVGGAYSIEHCWELVKCYERTKTPFTMLENCCYGDRELMIKNMVDLGVFGEVVHCDGGYMHDLREEITFGKENRHYRLRNYARRNCDNYPTHELGPIAKILKINEGNRMVSLTSMSSKAAGLHEYIAQKKPDDKNLVNMTFNQGDIVTTIIKCANGETIRLTLDTTLPRPYSRGFTIHGTKAVYEEANDSIFIDGESDELHDDWKKEWGNGERYKEKYIHPIWKKYEEDGVQGTHGGMDYLLFDHVFDCLIENKPFYIDVYDAASWMCITALSEKSIALGSMPVEIPDFTNGLWVMRAQDEL